MNSLLGNVYTLTSPKNLVFEQQEINMENIAENELVGQTIYSAISPGTETAAYQGLSPLILGTVYPRLVGYCNVAKVIATGKSVSSYTTGDYILTFQSHRSFFVMKDTDMAVKLTQSISLKHATTAYLYHLGFHGLITGDVKAGHNVGVIGLGTLGFTSCIMSNLSGAVTLGFSNQKASDHLIKAGVEIFSKNNSSQSEIDKITHKTGLDIIINTSNSWSDWKLALELVRKGGTIINLGFPGRGEPLPDFNPLDPRYVYLKNIQIKPLSYINTTEVSPTDFRFNVQRNLQYILDKIYKGVLNPDMIISEEINYKDLAKQYEKYEARQKTLYTTVLNWEEK